MSKPTPEPCPKCSGQVFVNASGGGRGTNDLTHYSADCDQCGLLVDHLSDTGRHDSAVRDYNRWARDIASKLSGQPPKTVPTRKKVVATAVVRDEFTRGFFCAVAQLINMHGFDTSARDLFKLGGDPALADALDIEVFRQHGLMP